jgi:two-component system sensor histidine kinase CreC
MISHVFLPAFTLISRREFKIVVNGAGRVIGAERQGKTAVVRILDEGPGIPAYAQNKIFDRFYSLARPSTGKRSSGLGLCFAREVANLHHGSVMVQNRRDSQGTEAVLTVAAAEPSR